MRKFVAPVTLSTLVALGAVATVAGTASALEPNSGIEQATVEQLVSRGGDDDLFINSSTDEQTTEPQAQAQAGRIVRDWDSGPTPSAADSEALHVLAESASREAAGKLGALVETGSPLSAQDMFEVAMLMNHLSQLSEMASSVMSPANAAISNMSRNIKS